MIMYYLSFNSAGDGGAYLWEWGEERKRSSVLAFLPDNAYTRDPFLVLITKPFV